MLIHVPVDEQYHTETLLLYYNFQLILIVIDLLLLYYYLCVLQLIAFPPKPIAFALSSVLSAGTVLERPKSECSQ